MQDYFDAVIFGFKEILKSNVMKFAILSSIVVSSIWIFIGVVFWDTFISFGHNIFDLLPFSMIRSNGAWMLSTFLWLQAVLITFSIIFIFLGSMIVKKSTREKFASASVVIGLSTAIFWAIIWFVFGEYIYSQFLKLLNWLPFASIENGLSYLIGFYLIYTGIIVSLIFVASAFSARFLEEVKNKHFPYDTMYANHGYKNVKQTIKDTGVFTIVSIISFPLLFVPVLNFVILVSLWVWLMKDTLSRDVAAFVFGEIDKEKLKEYRVALWAITLLGSLFNFIPILNAFAPYFTELTMFYYLQDKKKEILRDDT